MLHLNRFFSPGPKEAAGPSIESEDLNEDDAAVNTEEAEADTTGETEETERDNFEEEEELQNPEDLDEPDEEADTII